MSKKRSVLAGQIKSPSNASKPDPVEELACIVRPLRRFREACTQGEVRTQHMTLVDLFVALDRVEKTGLV